MHVLHKTNRHILYSLQIVVSSNFQHIVLNKTFITQTIFILRLSLNGQNNTHNETGDSAWARSSQLTLREGERRWEIKIQHRQKRSMALQGWGSFEWLYDTLLSLLMITFFFFSPNVLQQSKWATWPNLAHGVSRCPDNLLPATCHACILPSYGYSREKATAQRSEAFSLPLSCPVNEKRWIWQEGTSHLLSRGERKWSLEETLGGQPIST